MFYVSKLDCNIYPKLLFNFNTFLWKYIEIEPEVYLYSKSQIGIN